MKKNASKSWIEKKLAKKSFRKSFEKEIEKLSIGEQLTELRLKAGLTQAEVARRIGTTASAISRYENAAYDRYEYNTLKKIASACGGEVELVFHLPEAA
jgi:DNA-binding XRE family transcriptional regulator